ncbi:MAG: DUF3810 domain-containing protein [Bacteroidota bacterium]
MNFQKTKINFPRWLVLPGLAVFTFILTELAARNPNSVEAIYTQKMYPVVASTISAISSLIPFSLDDLFYSLLIVFFILLIALLIFNKIKWETAGKTILNILAAIYISFYFLWGFNYYRSDVNQRLKISEQTANSEQFLNVLEHLITQLNDSYIEFDNFDEETADSLVEASYRNLSPMLNIPYPAGKRSAKSITFSRFFAGAGISGYYGPFFNEIHLNKHLLPVEYPFILAHEKAHQFGVTSEAEANFYAWLVCTHSPSKQLKYSANLYVFRHFLYHGRHLEQLSEITSKLDDKVKTDFQEIREHWMELRNEKIDHAASKMNDAYLKTNKVEKGIEDYHGVVKHVMNFSLDSAFQRKWNLNSE